MRSARRPPGHLERALRFVLAGFIVLDILLIVPAFASELRLDRIHPSLPIVRLRSITFNEAGLVEGIVEELGIVADNIVGRPGLVSPSRSTVASSVAEAPLDEAAGSGPGPSVTDPQVLPQIDRVVIPSATSTPQGPVSSTEIPTPTQSRLVQIPTVKPSRVAVLTATLIHVASATAAWRATIDPAFTPDLVARPTPINTSIPPTRTQTAEATSIPTTPSSVPAFPGAEGFGAGSVGGRGGRVIEVTNLNDFGPGSFRAAVEASGPRIVVFRVAGTITLQSKVFIGEPYLTIAGQTAPGSGITIEGDEILIRTHNVVIRYLRWRGGGKRFIRINPDDRGVHDIIIDHCSASWGDDIFDIWYSDNDAGRPDLFNITVQNCIIAEALEIHPTAMMVGATWVTESEDYLSNIHNISIHGNLFIHNDLRNPRIKAENVEVINNVVYNWGNRIGGSERGSVIDWIGNYFKAGPMTSVGNDHLLRHESEAEYIWPLASIYFEGNLSPPSGYPDPDADNWAMITEFAGPNKGEILSEDHRRYSPIEPARFSVTVQSAYDAYDSVTSDAGASARLDSLGSWVSNYDVVDLRLLSDVQNGTGPSQYSEIEAPGDIGSIDPGTPYDDSDHDGMADQWELLYCLDPNDPSDGPGDFDGDGYTNVEEFLNGTRPIVGGPC